MSVEWMDTDGFSLAECREKLAKWHAAAEAIAGGSSYTIDGLTVTRADQDTVTRQIGFWQRQVNRKTANDLGDSDGSSATARLPENPPVRGGPYRWGT